MTERDWQSSLRNLLNEPCSSIVEMVEIISNKEGEDLISETKEYLIKIHENYANVISDLIVLFFQYYLSGDQEKSNCIFVQLKEEFIRNYGYFNAASLINIRQFEAKNTIRDDNEICLYFNYPKKVNGNIVDQLVQISGIKWQDFGLFDENGEFCYKKPSDLPVTFEFIKTSNSFDCEGDNRVNSIFNNISSKIHNKEIAYQDAWNAYESSNHSVLNRNQRDAIRISARRALFYAIYIQYRKLI